MTGLVGNNRGGLTESGVARSLRQCTLDIGDFNRGVFTVVSAAASSGYEPRSTSGLNVALPCRTM